MAGGRLAGKVALITGAGRGFGRAIAEAFAHEGPRVAANYLGSRAGAEAVVAEAGRLGAEADALQGDVAREDDEQPLVAATLARFERLDVLVNNAGIGAHGITVNAIAPGGIDTDMSRDVMTPEYRARRLAELPLHRFGSVDDVAGCAIVLASDEAGYLTGQILHPSGGWVSG